MMQMEFVPRLMERCQLAREEGEHLLQLSPASSIRDLICICSVYSKKRTADNAALFEGTEKAYRFTNKLLLGRFF
jgi:hypothetical protein